VLKNLLKWHTFTCASIHPPTNTQPGFSGANANQTSHGIVPSTKIIKLKAMKGKLQSPRRGSYEYTNHSEEETKSQYMKNNF
jgi:hypothetical protein